MTGPTTLDRIVGVLFIIFGGCGLLGSIIGAVCGGLGAAMAPEAAQQAATQSPVLTMVQGISSAVVLLVGIGVFMGRRWGFIVGLILMIIDIVWSVKEIVSPSEMLQQAAEKAPQVVLVAQIVGLVFVVLFGIYFLWRLTSSQPPGRPSSV